MTEPADHDEQIAKLQADVAALHTRLSRAEQDAAAARYLAGGADRDGAETRRELRDFREETRTEFADVRAEMRGFRDQNNRVLSAMREDLTDLRDHVDRGFAQADRNFLAVNAKIDGLAAGMQVITNLLTHRKQDDDPSGS